MRRILYFVLLSFSLSLQAGEWRSFQVRSLSGFGVQGSAIGEVRITDNCVCFKIGEAHAWVLPQLTKLSMEVVGIRFGLAYRLRDDVWDVVGYAPIKPIGVMISTDTPVQVSAFETSMPIARNLSGAEYWVVMQVVKRYKGESEFTFSYAHEEEGLNEP